MRLIEPLKTQSITVAVVAVDDVTIRFDLAADETDSDVRWYNFLLIVNLQANFPSF